jgi:hypothetical protein
MTYNRAKSILMILAFSLVGFAASGQSSKPPPSVFEKARKVFGSEKAVVMWVPSSGAIADATFEALSTAGPSKMARQLAETLEKAEDGTFNIAIAGADSSKTRRVITDALSLHEDKLPGLTVLFIGDPSDRNAVQSAVEALDAKFKFEAFQ